MPQRNRLYIRTKLAFDVGDQVVTRDDKVINLIQVYLKMFDIWINLAINYNLGRSYLKTMIEYERICANCAMIQVT